MKNKICLVSCLTFYKELQDVVKEYEDVEPSAYQSACHHQSNTKFDKTLQEKYSNVEVIGACMFDEADTHQKVHINKLNNCFYMFCPKFIIDDKIKQGAYIVTPGWVKKWSYYIKELWKFDNNSASMFYSEFCKKIVLLDTFIYDDIEKDLKEFCAFINQPYEIIPVGLDYFKLYIDNIIKDIRYKNELGEQKEKLLESFKTSSNYAMAFDLISKFSGKFDENEVINSIKEMYEILFVPQTINYFIIDDTQAFENEELEDFFNSEQQFIEYENGFSIKLLYNKQPLGIIEAKDIEFTKYIKGYLNLALTTSDVCALAIMNARNYKKNKEIELQLIQREKLAAMGEMMGSIAHQWRQPLNELHINIEMLEDFFECEEINEEFIAKFIEKNTSTIQFLSNTITDFSEFFKINKTKESFSIRDKIEHTQNIIALQLKNKNINLTIEGNDIKVYGYPNEFQQVIINLINNSKDAIIERNISDGSIEIKLYSANDEAIIEYKDNGGGIKAEILDRIFEPYFTTKEEGKGIGMGLYISKKIIDNMNGEIEVQNVSNGAQFIIRLPLEK